MIDGWNIMMTHQQSVGQPQSDFNVTSTATVTGTANPGPSQGMVSELQ